MTFMQSQASLNPALVDFWRTKSDLKILKGGRASSKTWDAAGMAVFFASNYSVKFLCIRQFQNKIQESVYAILKIQIERFGLSAQFNILKTSITHKVTGSSFHFYGMNRNTSEIKGFEGADICWIEEGEGLTKDQWLVIEPTLRKEGAEAWILYNPRLATDFIESFNSSDDGAVAIRHINYTENPFLSNTMRRKIERLKSMDIEEYEHVYLGIPRSDDDNVIIKRSWIQAAIGAHEKLGIEVEGSGRIGFDIADGGKDLCSQVHAKGIVAICGESWKAGEDELLKSCERVYSRAIETGSHVNYDSIGVGATAGAKFQEMNDQREEDGAIGRVTYSKFVAGAKVVDPDGYYLETDDETITNKDFFANLKAQAWWLVAERFRNTYNAINNGEKFEDGELVSIDKYFPNIANLVTELSTPRRSFDNAGRVKVESKSDLAKRGVPSHNDADAFIMAFAPVKVNSMDYLLELAMGQ